jgi:lysophospholipase L1-like esterase
VLSWGSAQLVPDPGSALGPDALTDATLRQVVRLSAGGNRLRVRLSNAFGTQPLRIDAAAVAIAAADPGTVRPGSSRPLLFAGRDEALIPAGAELLSDPVAMAVPPRARLTITLHFPAPPSQQTGHPGSRATSLLVHGNSVGAETLTGARRVEHWYQLSGIEVEAAAPAPGVVALGDSITDGHGATLDADDRWPDRVAARLQEAGRNVAVANAGIGGNRLFLDGIGPNALARFDRDVLAAPGVGTLIVLEGINDLGTGTRERPLSADEHAALVAQIESAYAQIVGRAHAHGIRVVGGTLTPFVGFDYYHPDAATEADRQAINGWIRASGHFDSVVDFDSIVRDPAHPERMRAEFDSGDHIHPSSAGYAAMAAAVPLTAIAR